MRFAVLLGWIAAALRLALLVPFAWTALGHAQGLAGCPPVAETLTPERVESGMRAARDHGFLWRISKGEHVSYLYGTIHLARLEWMFPGPSIVEALRESDTIALELDVLDPEIQRRLAGAVAAPRGFELPEALTTRLRRRMALECVAPETLATMGPEFQVATLTALAARRDGLHSSYSIDLMLAGFGRGAHKAVVSLETPEGQLQVLQLPTPQETIGFVDSALDDLDAGRSRPLLNRLAAAWVDGDHAELAGYDEWCECRKTPAERVLMQRLLDDRNPVLAERIDALHASGRRVFAAVGSLHLVGPHGLPALLAQRGYSVERSELTRR